jgi:hypothetical protein
MLPLPLVLTVACQPPAEDSVPEVQTRFATAMQAFEAGRRLPHAIDGGLGLSVPGGSVGFWGDGRLTLAPYADASGSRPWQGDLELVSVSRGDGWSAPAAPELSDQGGMVRLDRGDLLEWYLHRDDGVLEQGFSLRTSPPGAGDVVLTYQVDGLVPTGADPLLLLDEKGHPAVEISGLFAVDADGVELPVSMAAREDEGVFELRVDDRGARYPVAIDPLLQFLESATTPVASPGGYGTAIAIDGGRAVVGAPGELSGEGKVFILERNDQGEGLWGIEDTLFAPADAALFGVAVDIDFPRVLVGAPSTDLGAQTPKAYVYEFDSSSGWVQTASYVEGGGEEYGVSVALTPQAILLGTPGNSQARLIIPREGGTDVLVDFGGDGVLQMSRTLASSYPLVILGSSFAGTVQVYTTSAAPELILQHSGPPSHGASVDLDGWRAVVGAPDAGQVTVFDFEPVQLTPPADFDHTEYTLDTTGLLDTTGFGSSVSVYGDVIAVSDTVGGGRAHLFELDGDTWRRSYTYELNGVEGGAPPSVELSADVLMVGSPSEGDGVVYAYRREGEAWVEEYGFSSTGLNIHLGTSVAVDGDLAVAGLPGFKPFGSLVGIGGVQTALRDGGTWAAAPILPAPSGFDGSASDFGTSVAVDNGLLVAGQPAHSGDVGVAHVFAFESGAWQLATSIFPDALVAGTRFGAAVDIDGGVVAVGSPGSDDGDGGVYVGALDIATMTISDYDTYLHGSGRGEAGSSVSIDGTRVAFGAPLTFSNTGKFYVSDFGLVGTELQISDPVEFQGVNADDRCGTSIALEGDHLFAGCPRTFVGGDGKVRILRHEAGGWSSVPYDLTRPGVSSFGSSVAADGGRLLVGAVADSEVTEHLRNEGGADAWGVVRTLDGDLATDDFGHSVALEGSTALVGAPQLPIGAGYARLYELDAALPPFAFDDTSTGEEDYDQIIAITANDIDGNGDPFTPEILTQPASGSVSIVGLDAHYVPEPDWSGSVSFSYRVVSDTDGLVSGPAIVDIEVTAVNDPPTLGDPYPVFTVLEDQQLTIDAANGLLSTFSDIDGPGQEILDVGLRLTDQGGTVDVQTDGSFVYTPAPDFFGEDSFSFRFGDTRDVGQPDPALATIEVIDVAEAPIIFGGTFVVPGDEAVLRVDAPGLAARATIPSGDRTWTFDALSLAGELTIEPSGAFLYRPPADRSIGLDSTTVQLSVAGTPESSEEVTVNFDLQPVDGRAPVAHDDHYIVAVGDTLDVDASNPNAVVGVLLNDYAIPGSPIDGARLLGVAPFSLDVNGGLFYQPTTAGQVVADYVATSGTLESQPATITIDVLPVAVAQFTVNSDTYTYDRADDELVVSAANGVLANDAGDGLSAILATPPAVGTLDLSPNGSFTFQPPWDFPDPVTFRYRATDGASVSTEVLVTIEPFGVRPDIGDTGLPEPTEPTSGSTGPCDLPFYIDADGDGFGAADTEPVLVCGPEPGLAESDDDCDDTDADVHPGAPELAGDEIDQDCSGADASISASGACQGAPAPTGWLAGLLLVAGLRRRGGDA